MVPVLDDIANLDAAGFQSAQATNGATKADMRAGSCPMPDTIFSTDLIAEKT